MTKSKIKARTKSAKKELKKNNPRVYYPAVRKGNGLFIVSSPYTLIAAAKEITKGVDFWSPYDYTAKTLAISASGGYIGPEVDKNSSGYYYHYHLYNRVGGHSFFGTPVGGIY